MKQLFTKYIHHGIGFSKNGHIAYLQGEKPEFMFPEGTLIEPTVNHHIEVQVGRTQTYKRPLVMFYRRVCI
jgi:hypothetical protein